MLENHFWSHLSRGLDAFLSLILGNQSLEHILEHHSLFQFYNQVLHKLLDTFLQITLEARGSFLDHIIKDVAKS